MEEAYHDLSALVDSGQYKSLRAESDRQAVLADYKCVCALRTAVRGESAAWQKSVCSLSRLIEEEAETAKPDTGSGGRVEEDEEGQKRSPTGYKENVFGREDFFLYRGVLQFYCKNYREAIADFEQCDRIKKELKLMTNAQEAEEPSESNSIDTDLSDVGLCAVNVNEQQLNIVLCHIMVSSQPSHTE